METARKGDADGTRAARAVDGDGQANVSANNEGSNEGFRRPADERRGLDLGGGQGWAGRSRCEGRRWGGRQRRREVGLQEKVGRWRRVGRRKLVGQRRELGRRKGIGWRRRQGQQLLDLLACLGLVQAAAEEDVLPPEREEKVEVRQID